MSLQTAMLVCTAYKNNKLKCFLIYNRIAVIEAHAIYLTHLMNSR